MTNVMCELVSTVVLLDTFGSAYAGRSRSLSSPRNSGTTRLNCVSAPS